MIETVEDPLPGRVGGREEGCGAAAEPALIDNYSPLHRLRRVLGPAAERLPLLDGAGSKVAADLYSTYVVIGSVCAAICSAAAAVIVARIATRRRVLDRHHGRSLCKHTPCETLT